MIAATYGDTRVINVYVPNGQSVGSDKYAYKLDWLDALNGYVAAELKRHEHLAIVGDFNIAPDDRDVHDPELWRDKVLVQWSRTGAPEGPAGSRPGGYLPAVRLSRKAPGPGGTTAK